MLIIVGLAAKIGWAPVHNWLPDAHSEAPPPVSALLSAALLPAVVLVAWRTTRALEPAVGDATTHHFLIGFGLLSLAVAVPFLWRPLAFKRLLAYSSLEHMGVIALGIGFGSRLALAGVVIHVIGHALAKALGFYASIPLLRLQPRAISRPVRGLARLDNRVAGALAISLISLSGLPPSPLFFSELFVLLGGFVAGHTIAASLGAALLALGFLGLVHALIEAMAGRSPRGTGVRIPARQIAPITIVFLIGLIALAAGAAAVPHSVDRRSVGAVGRMSVGTFTADAPSCARSPRPTRRDACVVSARERPPVHLRCTLSTRSGVTQRFERSSRGPDRCFSRAAASTQLFRRSSTSFRQRRGTSAKLTIFTASTSTGTPLYGL